MATIIEHIETKERAVLLGAGFGAYSSSKNMMWWTNAQDLRKDNGVVLTVAVTDKNGNIKWVQSDKVRVVEIDGVPIQNFNIGENIEGETFKTKCTRCGEALKIEDPICGNCGLENK